MKKRNSTPKTALQRAIESRERGIKRMRDHIAHIQRKAQVEITAVEGRIREKQVLLDALKKGALAVQEAK